MELKTLLGFPYFLIVNLNKLYLLPIFIIFLTNNIKNVQLLNIIHKFRNSIFIQLIILLLVFTTYNSFINLNNKVEEALSTMDIYLKKDGI